MVLSSEARNAEQRILWQNTRKELRIDVRTLWDAITTDWPCATPELTAWPQQPSGHYPNDAPPPLQRQALRNVHELLSLWSAAQSDAKDLRAIGTCVSKLTETVRLQKTLCSGVLLDLNKMWLAETLPSCSLFFPWLLQEDA